MRKNAESLCFTIFFILLFGFSGLGIRAGEKVAQERDALRVLLPTGKGPSGWKISSDPMFFESHNLWEYIDGQAEMYLQYGFQLVIAADYSIGGNPTALVIDVYQMESPVHAFGIYAAERSPEDRFIDVGAEGYLGENVLNFWKGPYYIKITSFHQSPETKEILLELSRAVAGRIPGDYAEPVLFSIFPEENRTQKSERYIPQHFLGHSFLKNGYRVDYKLGENRYQLFLSDNDSPEEAEASLRKYRDFLESSKERVSHRKEEDVQRIDTESGKMIFQYRSFVGGVLNRKDSAEAETIIQDMIKKLRSKE